MTWEYSWFTAWDIAFHCLPLALFDRGFAFVVLCLERSTHIVAVLQRLQDTTAQIRVRGAFVLLVAFVALAAVLGLETILGTFIAGMILRLVDGDRVMTHPHYRQKFEAIGFGVFIPVFFVTSGLRFDLAALLSSPSTLLRLLSSWWRYCSSAVYRLFSTAHLSAIVIQSSRDSCRRHCFPSSWRHPGSVWNWA